MQTPLEIIESYGAPTGSYIHAIRFFREDHAPLTKEECEKGVAEIIGMDGVPSYRNQKEATLYFLYCVQETIRAYNTGEIPDMSEVWNDVVRRATEYISSSPWAVKDYDSEQTADDGTPKQKKGAKKEQSRALYVKLNDGSHTRDDIINAFMDKLGMSKAGATTYFHNLKKSIGFSGPKTVKPKREKKAAAPKPKAKKAKAKKGPSKGARAAEIYNSMPGAAKADVIAAIVKATGTSTAGANTYYCAARKANG